MVDTPEAYYRNALDLEKFGNGVANKLVKSYNSIIKDSVQKLAEINALPLENRPKYKAARLRALLKQTTESLAKWSGKSEKQVIKDLQGLAKVQVEFAVNQLEASLPAGSVSSVRSVAVSNSYAKSVVTSKPTNLNASLLSDDLVAKVKGVPESFSLTAKKGSELVLPNGETLKKNFRGLMQNKANLFARNIREGLLSGETTDQISRRLYGALLFEGGGKMKNNQISALVRTSVQNVSNQACQTVYEANQDITSEYRWLATLDSKTAPECRILDQQTFKYGEGPEPPQHFNCRCRTTAVLDYEKLGVSKPKYKYVKRSGENGAVPIGTSYGKWLSQQSQKYQSKALGGTKVKYFNALSKKYGPDEALKKLVRQDGSAKSLEQLQKTYTKTPSKKLAVKPKVITPTKPKVKLIPVDDDGFVKKTPRVPELEVATAAKLNSQTQAYIKEFKKIDLGNTKNKKWFESQKAWYAHVIPKDQYKKITPLQLARRIEDSEVALLQKKYDKAFKKLLRPKKAPVKRAPLKKWDDPSFLNKKLKGESKKSAVRKTSVSGKKTTKDLRAKPDPKDVGLTKAEFKKTEQLFDDWAGNDYKAIRGVQLQQAEAVGAQLNPGEVSDLKTFKRRFSKPGAQGVWARNADKMENYISKAPKWKGKPTGYNPAGKVDPDGTIYRGMAFRDPKVVDSIIEAYEEGKAGLTMESWSSSSEISRAFSTHTSFSHHSITLKQVNKHGTSIEPWNGLGEHEILQPSGVRYRVVNVDKQKWTEKLEGSIENYSHTEITLEAY